MFQTLTWLRGVGVAVFIVGGMAPLVWFLMTRWSALKPARRGLDVEPVLTEELNGMWRAN